MNMCRVCGIDGQEMNGGKRISAKAGRLALSRVVGSWPERRLETE